MARQGRPESSRAGSPRVTSRARAWAFVAVALACLGAAVAYALFSASRTPLPQPQVDAMPITRLDQTAVTADSGPVAPEAASAPAAVAVPRPQDAVAGPTSPPTAAKNQRDGADGSARPANAQDLADRPARTAAAREAVAGPPSAREYVLFRSTALGPTYGRVSAAYLDDRADPRQVTPLQCDRVYFAADRGLCLQADRGFVTTYRALLFDREFNVLHTLPLVGIPSRARLSPDGRRASFTVFVSGHSYAGSNFSTRTSIVDVRSGEILVDDLERFTVVKDGARIEAPDFNFWGVTFARDGNSFYATLATGGQFYLIEGQVTARRARVVRAGVECPSLSPDGTRVAFKRRSGVGDRLARFAWRLHVLDLATGRETALDAESRSVDDQVEWLDNSRILYALPDDTEQATAATNVWALPADGTGVPTMLLPLADSPAVLR